MTLPINYRDTILSGAVTALEAVVMGSEYATTLETVAKGLRPLTTADVSKCPAVGVYVRSLFREANVSQRYTNRAELWLHGIVRRDDHRWPGLDIVEVTDLVLADVEKALDQNPTRGVGAIFGDRDSQLSVDIEKDFAIFSVRETFTFKTDC